MDVCLTQDTRLLRLQTVLGPDVLLAHCMDLCECLLPMTDAAGGAGWHAVLQAWCADAHLELRALIGTPVSIELCRADGSWRVWQAQVTEVVFEGADGGLAAYRLVLQPWLGLLAHRRDSRVFQDLSVAEVLDQVLTGWLGQGGTDPQWCWHLDPGVTLPRRNLCIQYQETDLEFMLRLMQEEGLWAWWSHGDGLGQPGPVLHLADHCGDGLRHHGPVRFAQSTPGMAHDTLVQWRARARSATARMLLASADHRQCDLRPVEAAVEGPVGPLDALSHADVPGPYAYADPADGQRLVDRQREAVQAWQAQCQAAGSWREAAPATVFRLVEHPVHAGDDGERDDFVVLSVTHRVRSNWTSPALAQLARRAPAAQPDEHAAPGGTEADPSPVYGCQLTVQPRVVPVRPVPLDAHGRPEVRLMARPTVHGVQTATVIGAGEPIHTDRDHRVKVQFHWQRGTASHVALRCPQEDRAPGDDRLGAWVRVVQPTAGANWGQVFVPRVGQEVLVGFIGGDIDRPVVLGALYNGTGLPDGTGGGEGGLTPAWFPGEATEGKLQGHRHGAVFSGIRSQGLATSAGGDGAHSQLVLDDSPGAMRLQLSTSQAEARLQLGTLTFQQDNRLLQARGQGLDLSTQAWGVLRAGAGLAVDARMEGPAAASLGVATAPRQLDLAGRRAHGLAWLAQQAEAGLPDEAALPRPDPGQDVAKAWPVLKGLATCRDSLSTRSRRGGDAGDAGAGEAAAWARPDLVLGASAGLALHTSADQALGAAATASLSAGAAIECLAQRHLVMAARGGLSLYAHGASPGAEVPVQDIGMRLHAASGRASLQAQTASAHVRAAGAVDLSSRQGAVRVATPQALLLACAGAALRLSGDDICLQGGGDIRFKASLKSLTGGASASSPSLSLPRPADWDAEPADQHFVLRDHEDRPVVARRYRAQLGTEWLEGFTDDEGRTALLEGFADQIARLELVPDTFDRVFTVQDPWGRPFPGLRYTIRSDEGVVLEGTTDAQGCTGRFSGDRVEGLSLQLACGLAEDDMGAG
jgi:type VI secretion system secreted protein VgrG